MKVLHVITGLGDGGAEATLFRVVKESPKVKHCVISLNGLGKYGALLEELRVEVVDLKLCAVRIIPAFFKLLSICWKLRPTVIQTWMYHADLFGGMAGLFISDCKVVWNVRHGDMDPKYTKWTTIILRQVNSRLSQFIPHRVIYCSNYSRQLHERVGFQKGKSIVIPNGVDTSKFNLRSSSENPIKNFCSDESSPFVVSSIGRDHPMKDRDTLYRAIRHVAIKIPNLLCLVVGSGFDAPSEAHRQIIRALEVEKYIQFLGPRSDIENIYHRSDLVVMTSRGGESFPNVVLEALACGCRVISSKVGGATEILNDPNYLFEAEDYVELASRIFAVYTDLKRHDSSRSEQFPAILESLNSSAMSSEYQRLWQAL